MRYFDKDLFGYIVNRFKQSHIQQKREGLDETDKISVCPFLHGLVVLILPPAHHLLSTYAKLAYHRQMQEHRGLQISEQRQRYAQQSICIS